MILAVKRFKANRGLLAVTRQITVSRYSMRPFDLAHPWGMFITGKTLSDICCP